MKCPKCGFDIKMDKNKRKKEAEEYLSELAQQKHKKSNKFEGSSFEDIYRVFEGFTKKKSKNKKIRY